MIVLVVAAPFLPAWLRFVGTVALANALVVLGLLVLIRTGLVSFGQGLYYCIGGYAAGVGGKDLGITDAFALLALGIVASAVISGDPGPPAMPVSRDLLRDVLDGVLDDPVRPAVEVAEAGLDRRLQRRDADLPGLRARRREREDMGVRARPSCSAFGVAIVLHRHLHSGMGYASEAVRDNEIRVEYLGVSAQRVIWWKYVIAAVLAALGGGIQALASGHVGPDMAYWTTSGEFVFIAILGGTAHVGAIISAAVIFEFIKTFVFQLSPYTWQLFLGVVLLVIIMFLPKGLWSLLGRLRRSARRRTGKRE